MPKLKSYIHSQCRELLIDTDYEYSTDDVEEFLKEIRVSAENENFHIGDTISKEEFFDSSSLIIKVANIVANPLPAGQKVTMAFPNCNAGHWRLFIMQYDPNNLQNDREFFIIDSLHEDQDTVNAIFQSNIRPIFESSHLAEAFGIDDNTHCQTINLGLQSTRSDHNSSCGAFMLRNLRLLAANGIDALQNPEQQKEILIENEMILPSDIREAKEQIQKLQNDIAELELQISEANTELEGWVDEDLLSDYILLSQEIESDELYLSILSEDAQEGDLEVATLSQKIDSNKITAQTQLSNLKGVIADTTTEVNERKNYLIDLVINTSKLISNIRLAIESEEIFLGKCDEHTLELELILRADDAVYLASQDDIGVFEGVADFAALREIILDVRIAEIDAELAAMSDPLGAVDVSPSNVEVPVVADPVRQNFLEPARPSEQASQPYVFHGRRRAIRADAAVGAGAPAGVIEEQAETVTLKAPDNTQQHQ